MNQSPDDDAFVSAVRRQVERAKRQRRLTFWQGLSVAGAVGWMVSLPAVAGAFLGRWLDGRYQTGIFWTLALLLLGVAAGAWSAWRHVHRELGS